MADKETVERSDFKPNYSPTLDPDNFGRRKEEVQQVNHKKFARIPIAKEIGEGSLNLAEDTGTVYLVTKFNGAVLKVAFS